MTADGIVRIERTRGFKSTRREQIRRNSALIYSNEQQNQGFQVIVALTVEVDIIRSALSNKLWAAIRS